MMAADKGIVIGGLRDYMADPFTIRIFVPDGDPEGVRHFDRMNWTGVGVAFPRAKWTEVRHRPELQRTGVYILTGHADEDTDLPTLYIGQADAIRNRIESHVKEKDFWDMGIVFASTSGGLNRAHVTWLEYALINRATEAGRCHLDNGNTPQEPALSEAEKADVQGFLNEILQVLPLMGLRALEIPKPVAPSPSPEHTHESSVYSDLRDTIVVPAQKDGFESVFLGNNCWHAIRISGGMLDKIKYIAAYQTQPISAVTHIAPVERIEPYGEEGKYKLVFSEKAKPIGPIPLDDASQGAMQSSRYTSYSRLKLAKTLSDLFT